MIGTLRMDSQSARNTIGKTIGGDGSFRAVHLWISTLETNPHSGTLIAISDCTDDALPENFG